MNINVQMVLQFMSIYLMLLLHTAVVLLNFTRYRISWQSRHEPCNLKTACETCTTTRHEEGDAMTHGGAFRKSELMWYCYVRTVLDSCETLKFFIQQKKRHHSCDARSISSKLIFDSCV